MVSIPSKYYRFLGGGLLLYHLIPFLSIPISEFFRIFLDFFEKSQKERTECPVRPFLLKKSKYDADESAASFVYNAFKCFR